MADIWTKSALTQANSRMYGAAVSWATQLWHGIQRSGDPAGLQTMEERSMRFRKRLGGIGAVAVVAATVAVVSSPATTSAHSAKAAAAPIKIGVDLTYNNTDFWSAYINYESQYAKQMHVKLLGPLLSAASASLQNQQVEDLVNEGAKAVIVNPETATSLGPAISYAAKHGVQLVSVDTIVGVGKVYMVVRASNLEYGLDACAAISSKVK